MINIIESVNKSSVSGVEAGKRIAETSLEYAKLKALFLTASFASKASKTLIIGSFFFIAFIFLSVSAAMVLGNWFNNVSLGYFTVALFYIILGIVFILLRKKIENKVVREISDKFLNL